MYFRESQTAMLRPANTNSDFDKTDTQSSLASYGRMAVDFRRELSVPPVEDSSRHSSPNVHQVEEEDIFHPSSDDNFFKISNPVSERLADFESEINGGAAAVAAQERVNVHCPADDRRKTYVNGLNACDINGSEEEDDHIYETMDVKKNSEQFNKSQNDHIYETMNVKKTSEQFDKSQSLQTNNLPSWWILVLDILGYDDELSLSIGLLNIYRMCNVMIY